MQRDSRFRLARPVWDKLKLALAIALIAVVVAVVAWTVLSPDTLLEVVDTLLCRVAHAYGGRACS